VSDEPANDDPEPAEAEGEPAPGDDLPVRKRSAIGSVVGGGAKVVGGVVSGGAQAITGGARVVAGGAKVSYRTTRSFGFGFGCALRGIGRMMVTPQWWPYAVLPFLLSIVAFFGVWWWMGTGFADWIGGWAAGWGGEAGGMIATIVAWLAVFAAFVAAFVYVLPPFARLVSAPFMALFADRVVQDVSGAPPVTIPGSRVIRFVGRPIFEALVLLLLRVGVMLLASPLLLIPIAGQILFALLIFPIEAADLLDWAQSARGVPLSRRLPFLKANFSVCMGLGAGSTLFLFIPIVNLFVLPSLVVGAVLLDQDRSPDFPGNAGPQPLPAPEDDA
jgi:CysZ protein